jgi:hypothetical protein
MKTGLNFLKIGGFKLRDMSGQVRGETPLPAHWIRRFRHLESGARYVVAQEFMDYDGARHAAGESWKFLGYNFLPYEDGYSLFVELDGSPERRKIRLQCRDDAQASVIHGIERHLRPAPP